MTAFYFAALPSQPLAGHSIAVYAAGTVTLLTGLTDVAGAPLPNPFTVAQAGGVGTWGFVPPSGTSYDVLWVEGGQVLAKGQGTTASPLQLVTITEAQLAAPPYNTGTWLVSAVTAAPDVTAPVITGFDIPATAAALTVAISTFTATDAVGVTGWFVSENPAHAAFSDPNDAAWLGSAPTDFTFAAEGAVTLYAAVKDAAGNISAQSSDTCTITLAPAELLVDGGFETGAFVADENLGWVSVPGTGSVGIVTSPVYAGTYAAKANANVSGAISYVKQRVQAANKELLANFSMRFLLPASDLVGTYTSSDIVVYLGVNAYDSGGASITDGTTKYAKIRLFGLLGAQYDSTYAADYARDAWHELTLDMKAFVTNNLSAGKTWADVDTVLLRPIAYNSGSGRVAVVVDEFTGALV